MSYSQRKIYVSGSVTYEMFCFINKLPQATDVCTGFISHDLLSCGVHFQVLAVYSPWGRKESDTTEQMSTEFWALEKIPPYWFHFFPLWLSFFSFCLIVLVREELPLFHIIP